jgi:hypothetical protein
MALLVDIRNLKRIRRLQVEKTLFVRNNEYKKNLIQYCERF